ncbi:hypothetical protein BpHYR1_050452 [Brachionus plicatilis]|uniref:Uncharacterized protein n=1 Tax=Brachionus plicatilis TaxID=10195 RepID=A0A3M7QPJ4_BRAPC|nr:hypothetical protein BpHYR1_050452 [Brachionus plicatilis]
MLHYVVILIKIPTIYLVIYCISNINKNLGNIPVTFMVDLFRGIVIIFFFSIQNEIRNIITSEF